MLYLTLATILIGSCVIETSAKKLVVTSISDNTEKDVTLYAREVTPTKPGRVGWAISYDTMKAEFPNLNFKDELGKQLKATLDGRPLNHVSVEVNMGSRIIPPAVPRDIVATYIDKPHTFGLYQTVGNIEWSDCYFEADEK